MFSRTFAVSAKGLELGDPEVVLHFIAQHLRGELVGRKPFRLTLFADADPEIKKVVFYDVTNPDHVIEFSSIFGRVPQYSIDVDEKSLRVFRLHEEKPAARIHTFALKDGVIASVDPDEDASAKEAESLQVVIQSTSGLLDMAAEMTGKVTCNVVENEVTKERLAFFAVKLDERSDKNRAILRSCERMFFAWSDEASYLTMLCRFRMLPLFSVTFPIMGRNVVDAMDLYMKTKKAVGVILFTDDVSDSFTLDKETPKFD